MALTDAQRDGSVLQMEIDIKRWRATKDTTFDGDVFSTPWKRINNIAKTAVCDTIRNGGTIVVVCSETKITIVQRTTAEDFPEVPSEAENG